MPSLNYRRALSPIALLLAASLQGSRAHAEDCQIRLGQSEVDFGVLRHPGAAAFDDRALFNIGTRYAVLNATCAAPTQLTLRVYGDGQHEHFRFADQGQVSVRLSHALLDGRPVHLVTVRATGDPAEQTSATVDVRPGDWVMPTLGGLPVDGTLLSLQVELSPSVSRGQFETHDKTQLDTALNFELHTQ